MHLFPWLCDVGPALLTMAASPYQSIVSFRHLLLVFLGTCCIRVVCFRLMSNQTFICPWRNRVPWIWQSKSIIHIYLMIEKLGGLKKQVIQETCRIHILN